MITDSFDNLSPAIINQVRKENAPVVDACIAKLKTLGEFPNIHVTRAGCTVSSHCGRNTLGVLFIRNHAI